MAVSAVKKEAVKPDAAADAPPPKKKSLNWKMLVAVLAIVGAAGGGAYWHLNRSHDDAAKEAKAEPAKPPQFMPLDPFTVNLQLEDNPQFLQVGLTLRVADNAAVDAIKLHMPEVRDRILLLLSSQKASTLLTLDGKRRLATDIVTSINGILVPSSITADTPKKPAAPAKADVDATKGAAESDADAKPETESAEANDAPPAGAKPALPVLAVLFTSFIVQ
ncbi:MAG: flagellar basal body-associated protein FliL [Betaproteobacteria bacterium]|nr:flagellar basal body-associated protein FliL [Betaproteobacteria bacterium]